MSNMVKTYKVWSFTKVIFNFCPSHVCKIFLKKFAICP